MKLFLATPITNWIDPDTGSLFQHKRILLFSIKKELEKLGHTVFLAIEREAWGRDLSGPDESIEADLAACRKCRSVAPFYEEVLVFLKFCLQSSRAYGCAAVNVSGPDIC